MTHLWLPCLSQQIPCGLRVRAGFIHDVALRLLLGPLLLVDEPRTIAVYERDRLIFLYNTERHELVLTDGFGISEGWLLLHRNAHATHYKLDPKRPVLDSLVYVALTNAKDADYLTIQADDDNECSRVITTYQMFIQGSLEDRAKLLMLTHGSSASWQRDAAFFLMLYFRH